jgi:hypothetical protein
MFSLPDLFIAAAEGTEPVWSTSQSLSRCEQNSVP